MLDTVQATSTEVRSTLKDLFGGETDMEVQHFEEAGFLEAIPIDEEKIPAEFRNPRTTSAIW